jgi:hypothetical protein
VESKRLGVSIVEGVRQFLTVPECQVCKVREEMFLQFRNDHHLRVKDLQDSLDIERDEKRHLQGLVERLMRLKEPSTSIQMMPKIQGIISPQKQRLSREAESRKNYWAEKAKKVEDINVGTK